jgi:hypothetical protein
MTVTDEELAPIDRAIRDAKSIVDQMRGNSSQLFSRRVVLPEALDRILAELDRLRAENAAMRQTLQSIADDHVHIWEAVDPQEVWACQICHVNSQDYADETQEEARALLAKEE